MLLVAITCGASDGVYKLPAAYLSALQKAGLGGVILPPQAGDITLPAGVRGLLLPGGGDPHPLLWGEQPHPGLGEVDPARDRWEIALCRAALSADLPVFGICRGMQLLNVALGGTLWQDLAERGGSLAHWQSAPIECGWHSVVCRGTLAAVYGAASGEMRVNSRHHQGIRRLGESLRAAAYAPDGLIEAIELPERRFALGVQWHPERLAAGEALFAAFAAACGG